MATVESALLSPSPRPVRLVCRDLGLSSSSGDGVGIVTWLISVIQTFTINEIRRLCTYHLRLLLKPY